MRFLAVIAILIAAGASGCSNQTVQSAAAAGRASAFALDIPVGPMAGEPKPAITAINPYAKDDVAINEGRSLFVQYNCAGCHGGHAGGGMGPSLRDADWIYGSSDGQVFASIAEGRAHGMPAWGYKIPEQQMWKLVAYIKTLRSPLEAEPPE